MTPSMTSIYTQLLCNPVYKNEFHSRFCKSKEDVNIYTQNVMRCIHETNIHTDQTKSQSETLAFYLNESKRYRGYYKVWILESRSSLSMKL